jgi:hypothetical protein
VVLSAALAPFAPAPWVVSGPDGLTLVEEQVGDAAHAFGRMVAFHGQMGMFTRALAYMLSHGTDGLRQVAATPWTGVGYGTQVVRANYEEYIAAEYAKAQARGEASIYGRIRNDLKENATHQHMHNLWLEIAVESGLPALAAFIAFTLARWALLWRALRRSAGADRWRVAAWVAFELSVMVAGTLFYMLKHNFGMLNFFVWGCMLSELDAAERGETSEGGLVEMAERAPAAANI